MKPIVYKIIVLMILSLPVNVAAYSDDLTHPHLTEEAVTESNLNPYLQDTLGLEPSETAPDVTILGGAPVTELLQEGAELEDAPMCRASNHFHNPVEESWENAGLSDTLWLINAWCGFGAYPSGNISSSITWATGFLSPEPANGDEAVMESNLWDWESARAYFYTYLTGMDAFNGQLVAPEESDKNSYGKDCFRALGQVMHLIQDAAVPAHVRNDFSEGHTRFDPDSNETPDKWWGNPYEKFVERNDQNPSKTWFNTAARSGLSDLFLPRFWDTDQVTRSSFSGGAMNSLGLAEYTNMNFFSEFTMYNPEHPFPFPKEDHCQIAFFSPPPEEDIGYDRKYFSSTNGHPGEQINKLAVVSYLNHFKKEYYPAAYNGEPVFFLNEACYDAYAQKLIPKAIGYSADLLDYFFRGTLEVSNFNMQIDAAPGIHQGKFGFNKVTLDVLNSSLETEIMDGGSIELVVKYLIDENDSFDSLVYASHNKIFEYQYIVRAYDDGSGETIYSIPGDSPMQLEFDLSGTPIPVFAKEIQFYLVYRGKLGREPGGIGLWHSPPTTLRAIDIGLSDDGVYSLCDKDPQAIDPATQGFESLGLSASNVDPDSREMAGGTVQLVLRYRSALEDQFQNSPPDPETGFYYIFKEFPTAQAIPIITQETAEPAVFQFDLSDTQLPLWATDIYLYCIYNGSLGQEQNGTAVGFKDISEPTPITYYNSMDKVCIRGTMFNAGDEAFTAAAAEGKEEEWDVFPHDRKDIYIRYSSIDDPQLASTDPGGFNTHVIPYQAAGEHTTLFLLTDYQFALNHTDGVVVPTDSRDVPPDFSHDLGNYRPPVFGYVGLTNQHSFDLENAQYIRYIPSFETYRELTNIWLNISVTNRPLPEGAPENETCGF